MVSTLLSHAIPSLSGDLKLVNEANHLKNPLENTGTTEIMFSGKLNLKSLTNVLKKVMCLKERALHLCVKRYRQVLEFDF